MKIAIDLNDVVRAYTSQFASYYKKNINREFDIDDVKITTNNLNEIFPFNSEQAYQDFVYVDYPYELFGCAEPMHKRLPHRMNDWIQNDLTNMDVERPKIMLVSPFEYGLTIQSTHFFLSKTISRIREIFFPENSVEIWDKCDILITANPTLLSSKPDDKISIKIKAQYNSDSIADYTFDSLMDLMNDPNNTIENIITNNENKI